MSKRKPAILAFPTRASLESKLEELGKLEELKFSA